MSEWWSLQRIRRRREEAKEVKRMVFVGLLSKCGKNGERRLESPGAGRRKKRKQVSAGMPPASEPPASCHQRIHLGKPGFDRHPNLLKEQIQEKALVNMYSRYANASVV